MVKLFGTVVKMGCHQDGFVLLRAVSSPVCDRAKGSGLSGAFPAENDLLVFERNFEFNKAFLNLGIDFGVTPSFPSSAISNKMFKCTTESFNYL